MSKQLPLALHIEDENLSNYMEDRLELLHSSMIELTTPMHMDYYHWHTHYEILLIKQGTYKLINNRKIIESNRPGIFIHRPYTLHNVNSYSEIYHRKMISVTRDIVNRYTLQTVDGDLFSSANLICAWPMPEELSEIESCVDIAEAHRDDERITAHLYALIILRIMQITQTGRGDIVSCPFSYIQDVLNFMSDNISGDCTIDIVARHYNVSRSKFQNDFKIVTGIPFHRYLITLRQNLAYRMLLGGNSIVKTAVETGYANESHFVKAFREYWNITPGQLMYQKKDSGNRSL